jgi:hypothetical protein
MINDIVRGILFWYKRKGNKNRRRGMEQIKMQITPLYKLATNNILIGSITRKTILDPTKIIQLQRKGKPTRRRPE